MRTQWTRSIQCLHCARPGVTSDRPNRLPDCGIRRTSGNGQSRIGASRRYRETETTDMNDQTPYDLIGGEAGVRQLVDRFYDYMDSEPEAVEIRAMHARSLRASREKLFLFLTGWLGGPDLYVQKHGHPMLRRRHLPFAIGIQERDQWMHCMRMALADMPIADELREKLEQAFMATADHMRNRPEHDADGRLKLFPGK